MALRVLLVEGTDDEHVMKHVCRSRGLPQPDEVRRYDGIDTLLRAVPVQIRGRSAPEDAVGIVIDANSDVDARWKAVRGRLVEAGYPDPPGVPDPEGTVLDPPPDLLLPRAGVWLMPDNKTPGILENFLRFLVPRDDVLFDHAKASVESIPDRRFSLNDEPKAVIHTWLAWQAEPGRPYGTAITARYLDPGVPQVDVLVAWLRRLFA